MKYARLFLLLMTLTVVIFVPAVSVAAENNDSTPIAPRPTWTEGSSWRYDYVENGQKNWALHRYIGVVEENGAKYHLVQTNYWRFYFDFDFNLVRKVHVKRGVTSQYDPPFADFSWPLHVGKKWTQRTTRSGAEFFARTEEWTFEVVKYEKVKTAAGEFDAFRIRAKRTDSGDPMDKEYWYAPAVGRIIKYGFLGYRYYEEGELTQFTPR
jgi:hypothetical protein